MDTHHARPRTVVAISAVLAAVVLAPAAAAEASAPDPASTLNSAIAGLQGQGYNLTGTAGSTAAGGNGQLAASGSVDAKTNSAALEFKGTEGGAPVDIHFIQSADGLLAKINISEIQSQLGVGPDQWMSIDEKKVTNPTGVPFDLSGSTDALDINGLMTSVAGVRFTDPSDPTTITGTVDLTASTGVAAPDASDLSDAGAAAKTTPFTATVDSQGHLTDLKIDADGYNGDLSDEIMFTDFGSPDPIATPPASSVVPAPAAAYEFFNN